MKKISRKYIFLFALAPAFLFAQATYQAVVFPADDFPIVISPDLTITFPYRIPFTKVEVNFLRKLDKITLDKLVETAKQVKAKNLEAVNAGIYQAAQNTYQQNVQAAYQQQQQNYYQQQQQGYYQPPAGSPTVLSDTYSSQTPYYNSATGQYQNTPVNNTNYQQTNTQTVYYSDYYSAQTPYYNPRLDDYQNIPYQQ